MLLLKIAVSGLYLVQIRVKIFLYTCVQHIRLRLGTSPQRLIRNPNEKEFNEGKALIYTGEEEQYDDNAFVPVEVKAGKIAECYHIVY
jgi:major membrane immunogen (membrane-anchored lipoprotein)